MSPLLRLIVSADLDAYEADQQTRLDLTARYEIAVDRGDPLEIAYVEALAADYDVQHPDQPAVLDGLDIPAYVTAA